MAQGEDRGAGTASWALCDPTYGPTSVWSSKETEHAGLSPGLFRVRVYYAFKDVQGICCIGYGMYRV